MSAPIEQFRAAMLADGITPPEVIEADSMLHRFPSDGRRGDDSETAGVEGETARQDADPAQAATPHKYGGGTFHMREHGVYFIESDKDGKSTETWVCSPLHVTAKTRDDHSHSWGRLLEWLDDDHRPHRWAMPAEMLQGDGADLRKELAAGGLQISPGGKARNLLTAYIQTAPVKARARSVNRLGWHGERYVMADAVYGAQSGDVPVFQSDTAILPEHSSGGSVQEWRDHVAALAQGNTRLVFAICAALGGPMIEMAAEDSGGFNLRGSSSEGKTTALKAAASVWGNPENYVRTWRATANGLEGIAAVHNDGLLILDELHQCDPREAAEAAYMLANGQGKARASRNGTARRPLTWRLWFLSSGEQSLDARLASIGRRSTAGQEVRMAEIPADAGCGMGIVEDLHGLAGSGALVERLAQGYRKYHGTIGREWLKVLASDRRKIMAALRRNLDAAVQEITGGDARAGGQAARVARRFALAATAGDLATRYGLTGWPEGGALMAARTCYTAWLDGFGGTGNREERQLFAHVRAFLEAHGGSRFEPHTYAADPEAQDKDQGPVRPIPSRGVIRDRVGFTKPDGQGGTLYLVLPEAFRREVVVGYDVRWAADALARHGWLLTQDGRFTRKERIPALGPGTYRVYVLAGGAAGGDAP